MSKAFIYTLADPRDGAVRYVGKTFDLNQRFGGHTKASRLANQFTHKANWVKQLKALGLKPVMEPLEEFDADDTAAWEEAERFWIENLRQLGCRLTNLTSGGGSGHRMSPESRAKISVAQLRRFKSPESRLPLRLAMLGRRHTPASIEKMRLAHQRPSRPPLQTVEWTRGKRTPVAIERMRAAALLQTPEKRAKISAALKGRHHSPEARAKMSASHKDWNPGAAWRLSQSLAKKGKPLSPETRAKRDAVFAAKRASKLERAAL